MKAVIILSMCLLMTTSLSRRLEDGMVVGEHVGRVPRQVALIDSSRCRPTIRAAQAKKALACPVG